MKNKLWAIVLALGFGTFYAPAQNWKITQSDNTVILIGEDWIKILPGTDAHQAAEPEAYGYEMEEEDGEDGSISMYHRTNGRMVIINEMDQSYAEGTVEDYCQAIKSMRAGMDTGMLQQMIAEQKARPAIKISVTKAPGDAVMGYATTKYTIEADNGFMEEKWMSTDPALSELIRATRAIQSLSSEILTCSVPDASFLKSDPEFSEVYREVEASGFELMSYSADEYGNESLTEVISIEKGGATAADFQIPQGYTKRSFREFLMAM